MVRRKRALDGLGQDIRDHIERETQDNIDKGMAPEEARRQAMIRFGNVALTMEDTQAVWGWPSLDAIRQDLRYVLRTLRRKPAFALVVILTLGFGIGLTTATFSIVNAALIRPLGFADPERLVALHERFGVQDVPFSPPDFLDLRAGPAVVRGRGGVREPSIGALGRLRADPHRWRQGLSGLVLAARRRPFAGPRVPP